MKKDQLLGQIRTALTALGTMLATWGVNDGNQWAPVTGLVIAILSATWGILHHRDPATPGKLSWSLVRKALNAAGAAAITYGYLNPEKVQGIEMLFAAMGPLAASMFSWIDNSADDIPPGPDGLHILLLLGTLCFLLPGCAGVPLRVDSDFGTLTTDAKGGITFAPRAGIIHLPIHSEK